MGRPRRRVNTFADVYLTWRSARPSHSDAEVWTFAPVSSGPVPGRVALWTPHPTWRSRSRGERPTAVRRWWPRCWAVGRRERGRLKPRYSWWQVKAQAGCLDREGVGADGPLAQLKLLGGSAQRRTEPPRQREEGGGGASGSRTPEPQPGARLAPPIGLRQVASSTVHCSPSPRKFLLNVRV